VPRRPRLFARRSSRAPYRSLSSVNAAFDCSRVSCAKRDRDTSSVSSACVRRREDVRSEEALRTMSSCVCLVLRDAGRRLAKRAVLISAGERWSCGSSGITSRSFARASAAACKARMCSARSCSSARSALRLACNCAFRYRMRALYSVISLETIDEYSPLLTASDLHSASKSLPAVPHFPSHAPDLAL